MFTFRPPFCRIVAIQPAGTSGGQAFAVTVEDRHGCTATIDLEASDLLTYQRFQDAVWQKTGRSFRYLPPGEEGPAPHSGVAANARTAYWRLSGHAVEAKTREKVPRAQLSRICDLTVALQVPDIQAGVDFYSRLFGQPPAAQREFASNLWFQLDEGEARATQSLWFHVDDIEAERARIEREVGATCSPVTWTPGLVACCDFNDPWGNKLRLCQGLSSVESHRAPALPPGIGQSGALGASGGSHRNKVPKAPDDNTAHISEVRKTKGLIEPR